MIYFDYNKKAFDYEIKNYIATVDNETWHNFCGDIVGTTWDIVNGVFTDLRGTDTYVEFLKQQEQERLNKLTVTKRVFALALEQFGVTYTQLKELIASNERATLEWDLCVELERGNPLLDQLAPTFNITSEQLDYIFKVANGEIVVDEAIQT